MEKHTKENDGLYRNYFCGFCYPTASDGSDADEEAKEKGKNGAEEYTGEELKMHLSDNHESDILIAFYETFEDEHSGEMGGHSLWTGKKIKG